MLLPIQLLLLGLLNQFSANKPCYDNDFEIGHRFNGEHQSIHATRIISRILRTVTDLAYRYKCALYGNRHREAYKISEVILTNLCKAKQFVSCDHHERYYTELSCGNVYNCYEILANEVMNYDFHLWRGYVDIVYRSRDIGSCCIGPYRCRGDVQTPFIGGIYIIGNFSRCIKFYEWKLFTKSRCVLLEPLFIVEEMLCFSGLIEMSSRLDYEFFVYILGYYQRLMLRRNMMCGRLDRFKRLYLCFLYDTSSISILRLKIVNLLMLSCVLANEKLSHVECMLRHLLCGRNCDLEVYFRIVCRCYGENKILHSMARGMY